jgi:hypothetical protein
MDEGALALARGVDDSRKAFVNQFSGANPSGSEIIGE